MPTTTSPVPSFLYEVIMQSRRAYGNPGATAWLLDNKITGYRFAHELGLRTPIRNLGAVPHTQLELRPGSVVKPLTAIMSKGVYIVGEDSITDLARNIVLHSVNDLKASIAADARSEDISDDLWLEEDLVVSDHDPNQPARDLKFYCFYGVVGLALETVRIPDVRRCWYNAAGNVISTGKYVREAFGGNGIPGEYFELAADVSRQVPAPFVRIDFLASPEGPVLNEFTPKPGGASQFNGTTDRRLGRLMVSAAGRLHADLLDGRRFDVFDIARQDAPGRRG